jgi:DNA-binding NarL/FixJ family response regulator
MNNYIRIDIADDHPMIIDGIRNMLHYYRHIEIQHVYQTGKALLEGLKETQPDVLLLDIQLPDKSGNELARIISKLYPGINILALTSMESTFHFKDMIKSGCKGYLLKSANKEKLIHAIEEVHEGREFLEPLLKDQLLLHILKIKNKDSFMTPLTRREKEILELIASGLTSGEISEQLFLSQRTIENHRFSLMQKLNVKNTAALLKTATEMGFIK